MSGRVREPRLRDLDIYRPVVVRRWKQKHVAESFDVQPAPVSQVVRRVRGSFWGGVTFGSWWRLKENSNKKQARRVNASANMGIRRVNIALTTEHESRQELVPDERPIRGAGKI